MGVYFNIYIYIYSILVEALTEQIDIISKEYKKVGFF